VFHASGFRVLLLYPLHGVGDLADDDTSMIRPRSGRKALHVFAFGLLVRLIGVFLIWVGNGHTSIFSKVVVVIGVVLSVGGIAVLKWLAVQPRRAQGAATQRQK
jgi:hypothetical protein